MQLSRYKNRTQQKNNLCYQRENKKGAYMNTKDEFQSGRFDPDANEYILNDPRTPMPWMHYLFNEEYVALVSVTGGGYSFHKSAKFKRILRMRPNNVPFDRPGRYIYIRNNDTHDFHSAGWAPVMKSLDEQTYQCRLGTGYMTIDSEYAGIATRLTYFVPLEDNIEIWRLSVKNNSDKKLALGIFSYAEFALFDAVNDRDNYQYTYNIAECSSHDNFIFHETLYKARDFLAFFASSVMPASFDCDREKFIGAYNTEANPTGVLRGRLANSSASGGNPCAAQEIPVTLAPNEEKEIVFTLGIADSREHATGTAVKYFNAHTLDGGLADVKRHWKSLLSKFEITTPQEDVNTIINMWHPYQINTTLLLSRGPSIYEGGINRGIGFRDSNQDTLGPVYQVPARVKKMLFTLLRYQFKDGHALHGFHPGIKNDSYGDMFSDDHLWPSLSISNYIKETGDMGILDEKLPYVDSDKEESIFDHLVRAIEYTAGDLGKHGIPHIHNADWNDCLNIKGPNNAAESVWTGFLFHRALLDFIDICNAAGRRGPVEKLAGYAGEIRKNIYAHAWNGKWFLRAFDDDGEPVGSEKNKYAKVFLNAQSWSVVSGIASQDDGVSAMDIVAEKLDSEYGVALLWPAYRETDPRLGAITYFPPGLKENGGIFCHANTWVVIAECMLGRGDKAFEYYHKLLPAQYNLRATLLRADPYVYSQVIASKEHPDFGLARNSWLTGTASWMFIAFTQHMLGIRPHYAGLVIDPCIPVAWEGFSAKRVLRNTLYSIEVKNPDGVSRGVKSILVDGKEIEGNVIGYRKAGEVKVKVILGK
jgi:N,N'-diacetylchitobiose phosphorylase